MRVMACDTLQRCMLQHCVLQHCVAATVRAATVRAATVRAATVRAATLRVALLQRCVLRCSTLHDGRGAALGRAGGEGREPQLQRQPLHIEAHGPAAHCGLSRAAKAKPSGNNDGWSQPGVASSE
jgi:hypothetical protein